MEDLHFINRSSEFNGVYFSSMDTEAMIHFLRGRDYCVEEIWEMKTFADGKFEENQLIHSIVLDDGKKLFALCKNECSNSSRHNHNHVHNHNHDDGDENDDHDGDYDAGSCDLSKCFTNPGHDYSKP